MISDIADCGWEHQREYRRQTRAQCTGDAPTLPVPVSCGTRSLTVPAPGNMSAMTRATLRQQENRWWSVKLQPLGSREHFVRSAGREPSI
jgi:hypothetical protein